MRRQRFPFVVGLVVALSAAAGASPADAQERRAAPEFTRQVLVVTSFSVDSGMDQALGRRAGDVLRGQIERLSNKRELEVADGGEIRNKLSAAGFDPQFAPGPLLMPSLLGAFRADEYVVGHVERVPTGVRLRAELRLRRDERIRQPLPPATAPDVNAAGQALARSLAAARAQLVPQRRCENLLREGRNVEAMRAAQPALGSYPNGTLARTCYVVAMRGTSTPTRELLAAARQLVALDSTNAHGLETAAMALDSLGEADGAADMWLRLAATDTSDLDLAARVLASLRAGGNARRAEPLAVRLAAEYPDDVTFRRLLWSIAVDARNWPLAVRAGETLLARDSLAGQDSLFLLRLSEAYDLNGQRLEAVSTAARGAARFPDAVRLHAAYVRLVQSEADSALPRTLARFPSSAELHALHARALREAGRVAEALDATKQAVALDPTLPQGELTIAQAELDIGRPDSAAVALSRALARARAGDGDASLLAQFALSKGNALLRTATTTKARGDFELALRFITIADSAQSSEQSRLLLGTAALNMAQTTLTDAASAAAPDERCALLRTGEETLLVARTALQASTATSAEVAERYLGYAGQLEAHAREQVRAHCS